MNQRRKHVPFPVPPYGQEVLDYRRSGGQPNLFLHSGPTAWERAKTRPVGWRLCLPENADFTRMDWTCVRGLDVCIVHWGEYDFAAELARHLVSKGAALVVVLKPESAEGAQIFKPHLVFE